MIDKIIITIMGLMAVAFTFWFFFIKKEKKPIIAGASGLTEISQIDIIVEGGYSPEVISVEKGKSTKINFIRKDSNSCLEEVVLGDFKIRKYLPLNQKVTIEITPQKSGEFQYSCGMNMFHGKIIVIDSDNT